MGKTKGMGVLMEFEYILKRVGETEFEKLKAAISPADRELLFGRPILPVSWVDYNAFFRVLAEADRRFGKGDFELVRQAAMYGVEKLFTGVYKMFISLVSPRFILNNASAVWAQSFNIGKVTAQWHADKDVTLVLTEWPDIPLQHEYDQAPGVEAVIRLSGGRNVKSDHPKCIARGDGVCHFHFTWE